MAIGEVIGLTIKGDASSAVSAFDRVSDSLDALTKDAGKLGAALDGALFGDRPTKALGNLVKETPKLTKELKEASSMAQRFSSAFSGQLVSIGLQLVGLQAILRGVGASISEAFDRSKTDPALAATNELRLATEDLRKAWDDVKLAIINAAAAHVTGFDATRTRAGAVEGSAQASARMRWEQTYGRFVERAPFGAQQTMPATEDDPRYQQMLREERLNAELYRQRRVDLPAQERFEYYGRAENDEGGTTAGRLRNALSGGRSATLAELFKLDRKKRAGRRSTPWADFFDPGMNPGERWQFQQDARATSGAFFGGGAAGAAGAGLGGSGYFGADYNGAAMGTPLRGSPLVDIRDQLNDTTSAIGGTFAAMSAGLTAAVDAAITGSESIGKAALKASATDLSAIAIEATANSVFSIAEGIFGNPKGFAAAGQYAIAAAVAGAGAAALGAAVGSMGGGAGARTGGPTSLPGGGFARSPSNQNSANEAPIHVHIHAPIIGGTKEASKLISQGIEEGKAARRIRDPRSRVTRYQTRDAVYEVG